MTTSLAVRSRPERSRKGSPPPQSGPGCAPSDKAARVAAVGAVPLVRVRPAPLCEPPYDDEAIPSEPASGAIRATTRLGGAPPGAARDTGREPGPATAGGPQPWSTKEEAAQNGATGDGIARDGTARDGTARDRIARDGTARDGAREEPGRSEPAHGAPSASQAAGAPPRTGTGGHAAHRYVSLCIEVLEGFRPIGHLRRFTAPLAFESIAGQLARPVARMGHRPGGEALAAPADRWGLAGRPPGPSAAPPRAVGTMAVQGRPGAAASPGRPGAAATSGRPAGVGADRLRLRRLRLSEPREGVVEAVAVLGRAGRAWALALRLEQRGEAWLCTHVEVV
ncbi:hypothetical protein GCM10023322_60880 [Rugosimonospora acidiphila]|uniref:Uncharacterized protein n=1 Tax=Rugosimonospora acidiphila TaxID=556531 RepID=A0ABP9SH24_9ACTN